jgi:hypothetical protein
MDMDIPLRGEEYSLCLSRLLLLILFWGSMGYFKFSASHFAGLQSHNGTHCYATCSWIDTKKSKIFDFSSLAGSHMVEGSRLFTASGTQYFHQFNFTLCGNHDDRVACINNVSNGPGGPTLSTHGISSVVCRKTIIPSTKHSHDHGPIGK